MEKILLIGVGILFLLWLSNVIWPWWPDGDDDPWGGHNHGSR